MDIYIHTYTDESLSSSPCEICAFFCGQLEPGELTLALKSPLLVFPGRSAESSVKQTWPQHE